MCLWDCSPNSCSTSGRKGFSLFLGCQGHLGLLLSPPTHRYYDNCALGSILLAPVDSETRKSSSAREPAAGGDRCQSMAPSFTCDETPPLAVFDFPSLGTCPTDPAAHLLPSRWPQTPTPRVQDQKRPWHARSENTAYFSISLWSRLSKTFLLLYSSDQRLLLFLLLLLILFCSLITQSSLTMTLMLMRRWRGCFNELHSTSEELRRVRERMGSTQHQNTPRTSASAFYRPWPLGTRLMREWNKEILNCTIKRYRSKSSWSFVKKWRGNVQRGEYFDD